MSSGFTVFQRGNPKSACSGRIVENDSLYLPLSCEQCDTVISSLTMQALAGVHCLKFVPSKRIERIARKKGFETIDLPQKYWPRLNPDYKSVMNY